MTSLIELLSKLAVPVITVIISLLASLAYFKFSRRLSMGLSRRKIYIFSDVAGGDSIKKDIEKMGYFREKNIERVAQGHYSLPKGADLIILDYWKLSEEDSNTIIENKTSEAALIVYSPTKATEKGGTGTGLRPGEATGRLPDHIMERINKEPFASIVNMRGRLLSDLFIALIASGNKKAGSA